MKNLRIALLLLIGISFYFSAKAVDGVFLTLDDYKEGRLLYADKGTLQITGLATKKVTFKDNGVSREYEFKDVCAVLLDGTIYHCGFSATGQRILELMMDGQYQLWRYRGDDRTATAGEKAYYEYAKNGSVEVWYVSQSLDGKAYPIVYKKDLEKIAAEHKEFQEILTCSNKQKGPIMTTVGMCIMNMPGYREGKAIPPLKRKKLE